MALGLPPLFKLLGPQSASEELVPELLEIMDDEEPDVKSASIQALGYIVKEDLLFS